MGCDRVTSESRARDRSADPTGTGIVGASGEVCGAGGAVDGASGGVDGGT